jgi:hypothetical protein
MLPEPIQVILKVTEVFNRLNIPYLVGGSMASAVQGVARATIDADLVADIQPEQVQQLSELLENEFYIDPEMILNAIVYNSSFNLIHLDSMFKVDVFILKRRPFDLNEMRRRVLQNVGDSPTDQVYFSSAEDTILAKLEWFRMGGEVSDRQWRDVLGVLGLQFDRLDFEYLKKWSLDLGVQDLLQRALTEANLPGQKL